jgi:DNA-binding transcriptional LysR family regulator
MQTRFTLRQLEYLVAVGRCGGVSLAAEQLNVSAPSISTAIQQLETELGLALFVRKHAHGMSPSQSGREIIREAETVLASARRLTELANTHTGAVRGELRVGCLLTFAQIVVPQLRRSFLAKHAGVDFRQFELHQAGLIDGLRGASLDAALTYDLAIPADLEFLELAVLPPFAVFSERHELARRKTLAMKDLADQPLILLDLPLSADYFLSLFSAAGLKPRIAERTRDLAVAQSLVANDFGYSIGNFRPVSDLSPDGRRLCFVPLTGAVKPLRMGILCASGSRSSLTIRAFIDHCRSAIPKVLRPEQSPAARRPRRPV